VIISFAQRIQGQWKIFQCHQLSNGNAKNYEPLKATIRKIITSADVPEAEKNKVVSSNEVDLAFAMDCTLSMGSYISQAQQVKGSHFSSLK
jgi:hypothetical protein